MELKYDNEEEMTRKQVYDEAGISPTVIGGEYKPPIEPNPGTEIPKPFDDLPGLEIPRVKEKEEKKEKKEFVPEVIVLQKKKLKVYIDELRNGYYIERKAAYALGLISAKDWSLEDADDLYRVSEEWLKEIEDEYGDTLELEFKYLEINEEELYNLLMKKSPHNNKDNKLSDELKKMLEETDFKIGKKNKEKMDEYIKEHSIHI